MSIKVGLTSSDVDRQINLLNVYPEIANKYYGPTLRKDVQILKDMILMEVPVRTGRAQKGLRSKVTGQGTSIVGEVGWYRKKDPSFYIRFVDAGTAAHDITGRGAGVLKFKSTSGGGEFRFAKSVQHPGVSARGFMQRTWDQAQTMVTTDLAMANEAIVRELAIP